MLLGIGAVTLWRTRRTDDGRIRRYVRRGLTFAGALLAVGIVLFPVSIAYVVTHTARAVVPAAELGAPHENVSFATSDGLDAQGMVHRVEQWRDGHRLPRTRVIAEAGEHARRHGYGVLLFDRRGEGESEGDPNTFGWVGDRDVHAAARFLRRPGRTSTPSGSAGSACRSAAR